MAQRRSVAFKLQQEFVADALSEVTLDEVPDGQPLFGARNAPR